MMPATIAVGIVLIQAAATWILTYTSHRK